MRLTTPENITELKENEIFVFGSNEAGKHGKGAALTAKEKFGARDGQGYGPHGQSFAIPTKNWTVDSPLPLKVIECYAVRFTEYAAMNPDKVFMVTKIGCGLAGYTPEEVGPFFALALDHENISLPQEFWDAIDKENKDAIYDYLKIEDDGAKNELRKVS